MNVFKLRINGQALISEAKNFHKVAATGDGPNITASIQYLKAIMNEIEAAMEDKTGSK